MSKGSERSLSLLAELEAARALSSVGLQLGPSLSYERYEAVGALLGTMHESMRWAIGDWLLAGERLYGHEAYQASEALGLSPEVRAQYVRVAQSVAEPRRYPPHILSWSHHRAVAPFTPAEQEQWLRRAKDSGWTKGELERAIRNSVGPATTGRGASVQLETQVSPEPARSYVVEAVEEAARTIISVAVRVEDGFLVPTSALASLAAALGLETSDLEVTMVA